MEPLSPETTVSGGRSRLSEPLGDKKTKGSFMSLFKRDSRTPSPSRARVPRRMLRLIERRSASGPPPRSTTED